MTEHSASPLSEPSLTRRSLGVTTFSEATAVDGCDLPLYVAMPKEPSARVGAVLLIPHKHGLDPHTRQLAEGLAGHGMIVVSADLLARLGGTERVRAGSHPSARGIPAPWHVQDLQAATDYLSKLARGLSLTAMGEAFGCELAVRAAREDDRLRLLVTVYGPHDFQGPPPADSVLSIYAEDDVQRQRAADARHVLSGWRDASVVTVAETHRPFLDEQRPDYFEPSAADAVIELVADWITRRSP